MKFLKALIVEDSEDDVLILLRHLERGGYEIEYQHVQTAREMQEALQSNDWQIVLSDYSLPQFDGLMALSILKEAGIDIPFIIISGTMGEDTAVQTMLAGVDDYFVKGNLNRLIPAIEREIKECENRHARRRAEMQLEEHKKRLQLALNAAGMGVWDWNLENNEVYWSPECFEIFGSKNFSGKLESFKEFIHPEDRELVLDAAYFAVKSHSTYQSEFRAIKPSGDLIWLANHGLIEYDRHGKPLKLIGTVQDITQRKKAENDLRESEERVRLATDVARMFSWESDHRNRIVKWSENAAKIIGCLPDELPDSIESAMFFVHAEEREKLSEKYKGLFLKNENSYQVEFRGVDGKFWKATGVIFYDNSGSPTKVVGVTQDITESKLAVEALRESEESMRAIIEASTQFIFTADENGSSPEVFRWFSELGGRTITDVQGIYELMHPADRDEIQIAWREAVEKKTIFDKVIRYKTKTGEYCYLASRSVPMFNPDGSFRQWVGTFHDITERLTAEEQLKKSEERFRSLVNATSQIVWTADAKGRIIMALTKEGDAFDGTKLSLTDQWIERLHPDERDQVISDFTNAIMTKNEYSAEFQILHSDGTYHYFVARGVPIYEKDGAIREWVGTLTDVTAGKLSEEKLRKSEEQLRQAQKLESVGRLAGGIAHDFNNMLTAINGYSDLALRRLSENDPLRRNLEEIKKAGERSAALTQQLLAFSRRTILQMQILDINQIVSDSIIMFQRLIGEDIQLTSCLDPKIDQIKADSGLLSQMLLNLVVNSRDAMPKGGVITIETENAYLDDEFVEQNPGSSKGHYVMLAVSDTGIGIDEETRQMIFEPFFTTKEIGKGTGLGLSTVYGIVNQLGGYIVVKSTVGVGTTFEIFLPSAAETKSGKEERLTDGEIERGVETILLVEDEELVRNLTRQVLETCGYEVIEANSAFEAIEFCRLTEKPIDLLLTDVVMPKMSGRELAKKIKEMQPSIKILFTSGYTADAVVRHGISELEMNFIQKPFSFDELSKKVRKLLDGKKKLK